MLTQFPHTERRRRRPKLNPETVKLVRVRLWEAHVRRVEAERAARRGSAVASGYAYQASRDSGSSSWESTNYGDIIGNLRRAVAETHAATIGKPAEPEMSQKEGAA